MELQNRTEIDSRTEKTPLRAVETRKGQPVKAEAVKKKKERKEKRRSRERVHQGDRTIERSGKYKYMIRNEMPKKKTKTRTDAGQKGRN